MRIGLATATLLLSGAWTQAAADPAAEVRTAFATFVAAQNAHDLGAVAKLLREGPEFVWVTRGTAIWGRDKALERFAALYAGTWELKADPAEARVVLLAPSVAQLIAPVRFRIGPPGQPASELEFVMTQAWVREGDTWRVGSLLPIPVPPAPAPPPAKP
ncbi:MAG: nuclear transport factor 2 family protein [Proteobacteria bacterium]|nr:nuclear transport factor 2 family protein [Pseudomonadota bacterium]